MSMKIKLAIVAFLMAAAGTTASAQRIAISTNLLEDVILTPNIGVEIMVSDRQSLTFDASYAPYKLSHKFHNKRMTVRAGYRYWFSQTLYAHFISVDAVVSSSDVRVSSKLGSRDEYIGIGIGYGYSIILGKRLNLVPNIGAGIAYGNSYEGYDQMVGTGEGVQASATRGFKPILTRLGVTIQYVLK